MRRLLICLLALLGFGLGSAWALLQRREAPPVRPVMVAGLAPTPAPVQPAKKPLPAPVAAGDPASVGGYSGTAVMRAGGNESVRASKPRVPVPPRGRVKATDEQLPGLALVLAKAARYDRALECMDQAGQGWQMVAAKDALPDYPDWKFVTRFQREPDKLAPVLFSAFDKAAGVARQNIIFQVALALPEGICLPWLNKVRASADAEDAEDALCALAFRGDVAAMAAFESLALTPTAADCRVIADSDGEHDRFAAEGRRGLLRSYRCVEMLDCKPYFWLHSWSYGRGAGMRFPWADEYAQSSAPQRAEIARRLLPHWIARFEGHPGSDDMAWRLCNDCQESEQWLEAARWASRCATFPDQDMTDHGVGALTTLAERRLDRWQLDSLLSGPDFERNRTLLQYIRLRRAAATEGFDVALREAAIIAASERDGQIGRCFDARWSVQAARGLDSGLKAMAAHDPLKRVASLEVPREEYLNPVNRWRNWGHMAVRDGTTEERRLRPPPEAVTMSGERLSRQFRLWETMAELQRRRDAPGADRPELEYKIAAVYYHENMVIYPCYAKHSYHSALPSGISWGWDPRDSDDRPEESAAARAEFASCARAAELFKRLAEQHPNWPGRDRALFSAAKAHFKLADYRPFWYSHDFDIPRGVELFEQLAREHPRSNLSDDAQRAADYWRRTRRELFT